jgi:hypothetical protein
MKRLIPVYRHKQKFVEGESVEWINRILLEISFLYLKSIDNKSIILSAKFFLFAQESLILNALVDSGASARGFINCSLVKLKNIRTYKTPYTRTFILDDDRALIEKIVDYIIAFLRLITITKTRYSLLENRYDKFL